MIAEFLFLKRVKENEGRNTYMVVATILGGMGNQLRAYATAYTVAAYLGQPLIMDVSDYFGGYFRPYVLDLLSIPNSLKIYYPQKEPIYNCPYGAPVHFLTNFDSIINTDMLKDREELLAAVGGKQNVWLMGYGKLSYCTSKEKEELKKLFQPANKSGFLQKFTDNAEQRESVAVHIRRTDFIDKNWAGDETLKYYQAAINYLRQEIQDPEFFFFSDDMEWVKNALGYSADCHYIDCFGGREADLDELFCMAACKHHVLTDKSTFSAWGAFLSPHKGINIANGNLDMDGLPEVFVMDRDMVEHYCGNYEADYGMREEAIAWDELERMLEVNDNAGVIDYIDKLSLNAYGVPEDIRERLMELKAIAHIQNNNVEAALSVLDSLQQKQRDTYDFSFNYSIALGMAGYGMESLLYWGNALRINEPAVPDELKETKTGWEGELLRLIKEQRKRHYIFLDPPCVRSKNVKGYYESIAIMLRNMGNTVSMVEIQDTLTIDVEWSKNMETAILSWMLNTAEKQDRVYNWDIDKYQAYSVNMLEEKRITVPDFLVYLAEETGEQVILLTHSIEGIRNASGAYPLIFLDSISEWDVWKSALREYGEAEWNEIYGYASKVITERQLPLQWADKKVRPFGIDREINKTGAEEIIFREDRITILEHYMRNEESLSGMLSVLKAVEEVG